MQATQNAWRCYVDENENEIRIEFGMELNLARTLFVTYQAEQGEAYSVVAVHYSYIFAWLLVKNEARNQLNF